MPAAGSAATSRPPVETVLKWIAAVAAVLSLVAGSFQVTRLFSDVRERKRLIAESLDVAQRQQAGGDFVSSWTTLETGLKSADEGGQFAKLFGQLSEERRRLRIAQEELAMQWLRNVRVPADRKFADVVDRLLPVLDRGVAASTGSVRADRLAHVGWAYYLKSRDGSSGLDPVSQYRAALQVDPDNPYAHAYWGHWMVWQQESLPEALAHFDAAAKNDRVRPFVRSIELAALRNRNDTKSSAALVRLVDEMRRNGEPVSPGVVSDVYSVYHFVVLSGEPMGDLLAAMAAPGHIELIAALLIGPEVDVWKGNVAKAAQAMFQEAAGDAGGALTTWRAVRASLSGNEVSLRSRADAALRRLQSKAATKGR